MLACCAQEEESRESEAAQAIRRFMSALDHPKVRGVREWFMKLPEGLNPNNDVFVVANHELGVSERWAARLKTLYILRYRNPEVFRRIIEE